MLERSGLALITVRALEYVELLGPYSVQRPPDAGQGQVSNV